MALLPANYAAFASDVAADGVLAALPHNSDSADAIATAYKVLASPDFWVWKTVVQPAEYAGANGIVWTAVDALAAGKARIFEWMTGGLTRPLNAADPNIQQGLADAFGAASQTMTNFKVIGRRRATRIEKLLATGTGSTGSPATMQFEGALAISDVMTALGWG